MFLRIDKLQIELPLPKEPEPNAAAALRELLGGKYGEMSTLGNYLFQSFNFRSKCTAFRSTRARVARASLESREMVDSDAAGVAGAQLAQSVAGNRRLSVTSTT